MRSSARFAIASGMEPELDEASDGLTRGSRKRSQVEEGQVSPRLLCQESLAEDSGPPASKRTLAPNADHAAEERSSSSEAEDECAYSEDTHNTLKNNKWAVTHFTRWLEEHNEKYPGDPDNQIPADILRNNDPDLINKWLSLYAEEARRQDGKLFPANSVYMLLAGLARHMRAVSPGFPNILNSTNLHYKPLHDSLENTFRKRKEIDALNETKTAEPLSPEEEELLWTSGALSTDTPKGLLRTLYFLNSKHFSVFGANKHRLLKLSQFKRFPNPPRYVYTYEVSAVSSDRGFSLWTKSKRSYSSARHGGKTPGGRGTSNVVVDASPERGNRCHVYVLDCYMQKIPPEAFNNDTFYLQPLQKVVDPTRHWYSLQPLGSNALGKMVKEMCADAGIVGARTLRYAFRDHNTVHRLQDSEPTLSSPPTTSSSSSPALPSPPIIMPPLAFLMQGHMPPAQQQPLVLSPTSTTQTLSLVPQHTQPAMNHLASGSTNTAPQTSQPHGQRAPNTPGKVFVSKAVQCDMSPRNLPSDTPTQSQNDTEHPSKSTTHQTNTPSPDSGGAHSIPIFLSQPQNTPQQLSFANCQVTIYISPYQPQPPPNSTA